MTYWEAEKLKNSALIARALLALPVVFLCNKAFAEDQCQLQQYTSVPITLTASHHIFVPASLDGTEFQFLLMTGTFATIISHGAADQLGLHAVLSRKFDAYGFKGPIRGFKVTIGEMKLGTLAIHNIDLAYSDTPDVTKADEELDKAQIAGKKFGGDLALSALNESDVEIDLNAKKLNVFSSDHCDGAGLYWAQRGVVADIHEEDRYRIVFRTTLNGKDFPSELVTSFGQTTISWRKANALGISPESPGVTLVANSASGEARKDALSDYVLQTLQIGGEKLSNFPIKIQEFKIAKPPDTGSRINRNDENVEVSIGTDFLMLNRVYIAPREHKMYFTPYTAEEKRAIAAGVVSID